MAKTSIYRAPHYCLSFGNDTVFIDVEVEITKLSEEEKLFSCKVLKLQLDGSQEAFPIFLLNHLSSDKLAAVLTHLREALLEELKMSLFSLYYAGDLQQDAPNTSA